MQKVLSKYAANLATVTAFMEKFGLQERETGVVGIAREIPSLEFYLREADFLGDTFGRDGWMRFLPYGNCGYFSWKKVVDGVELHLYRMEEMPQMKDTPVLAKEWPVQLKDAK